MARFKSRHQNQNPAPASETPSATPPVPSEEGNPMQEGHQTIISDDIEITGSVKCGSTIQLDGKLNGDLTCGGNAIIGANAVIKGNITAKDRIELKSTAKLTGDIRSRRLSVEDGATLVGKSEVNPSGAPGGPRQAPPAEDESDKN